MQFTNYIVNFDAILTSFHELSYTIVTNLTPTILTVAASLCIIDLVLTFIFFNPSEGVGIFATFIKKVLYYSFWIFVIKNWYTIVDEYIFNGFIQLGNLASNQGSSTKLLFAPAFLMEYALDIITDFFVIGGTIIAMDAAPIINIQSLPTVTLMICIGIFIMAVSTSVILVIAFIKFWLSSSLAIICVPFSFFSKTKQIAMNALLGLIPQGLEIATMVVILNVIKNFGFSKESIDATSDWSGLLGWLGYYLIFFALLHKVPAIVGSITSGALSNITNGSSAGGGSGIVREGTKGLLKGANENMFNNINDFKKAMGE